MRAAAGGTGEPGANTLVMASTTHQGRRYRARVAPRRGGSRGKTRLDWDRVGRIALVLAVFAIGLLYVSPVAGVISTWRESNAAEQRLAELRVENDELKSRSQALKEPAAAIQEARKLGLVAPGEAAYKIEGLGPASP